MKKKKYIVLMGTALVLTACGSTAQTDTSTQTTADAATESIAAADSTQQAATDDYMNVKAADIRAYNTLDKVMERHDNVYYETENHDDATDTINTSRYFIYRNDNGDLQMRNTINDISYNSLVGDADTPTALYQVSIFDDETYITMTLLPKEDIPDLLAAYYDPYEENDNSEPNAFEDDALIVTTREKYGDADENADEDGYIDYFYYVNPDTLELYSRREDYYFKAESDAEISRTGFMVVPYQYDIDASTVDDIMDSSSYALAADGDESCKLTIVFNPGKDSEETQVFQVKKGTEVCAYGNYLTYWDEACSDAADQTDYIVEVNEDTTLYAAEASDDTVE